jgi:hypothetical protein
MFAGCSLRTRQWQHFACFISGSFPYYCKVGTNATPPFHSWENGGTERLPLTCSVASTAWHSTVWYSIVCRVCSSVMHALPCELHAGITGMHHHAQLHLGLLRNASCACIHSAFSKTDYISWWGLGREERGHCKSLHETPSLNRHLVGPES